MIKLESKEKSLKGSQENVYSHLTDLRNFKYLLPEDRLKNLEINAGSCSFVIDGIGAVRLKIAEKDPCRYLKIEGTGNHSMDLALVFQLVKVEEMTTIVKASLQANLNMFLEMMAKNSLQQILDLMMDKLSEIDYTR